MKNFSVIIIYRQIYRTKYMNECYNHENALVLNAIKYLSRIDFGRVFIIAS